MGGYQELSLHRPKLAFLIGALVGPPLIITAEIVSGVIPLSPGMRWQLVVSGILFFSLSGFLFAVYGMVFIAMPAWWMLHQAGMTTWIHAVVLGVVLTFFYAIGIWLLFFTRGVLTPQRWNEAIQLAVPAAFAGGLVGLIVWRVAYRRLKSVAD
jgi:hypothetical protein